MSLFGMRFDMRTPGFAPGTGTERYRAAVDMAAWADRVGFLIVVLSEHHGSSDGYLPSPIPMAAAMAARTENIRFMLSAMIAPFHDPLRLAEDLAVVDLLSGGRIDLVLANGYVQNEFDMFDVPIGERARRTTETLQTLKAAWTGEPFDHRGRMVQVLPMPAQPGGPRISLGGSVEAAARRAASRALVVRTGRGTGVIAIRPSRRTGAGVAPSLSRTGPPPFWSTHHPTCASN